MQLDLDYSAYTLLKDLFHFAFFQAYHAFKSREGIVFRTNLAERFKILYFELNKKIIRPICLLICEAF